MKSVDSCETMCDRAGETMPTRQRAAPSFHRASGSCSFDHERRLLALLFHGSTYKIPPARCPFTIETTNAHNPDPLSVMIDNRDEGTRNRAAITPHQRAGGKAIGFGAFSASKRIKWSSALKVLANSLRKLLEQLWSRGSTPVRAFNGGSPASSG